ncbi:MAG: peptidoglycan bridge formation glycyltransferase FemA/FemB family protein [Spirochaetales bacterium]|nr:peptidoglycan bridge formation glycyltransferase FemA/FemB family protein [Spirochaetales bacterium]
MSFELHPAALCDLDGGDNLFQSPFWGLFKSRFGWTPHGFRYEGPGDAGTLLALSRDTGGGLGMAYVPQGPDLPLPWSEQGRFLESLSRLLQPHLPRSCVFLRYDLPWETPYAAEREPEGQTDPRPDPPIRELRMNFGTSDWNLRKAPTDLLPPDTVIVELDGDEDRLLARMTATARYNVRMSARRGVSVRSASAAELPVWYRLYAATTRRQGIERHPLAYFRTLLDLARAPEGGTTDIRLLLARVGDSVAAGMLLALQGRRAMYLFGASSVRNRAVAPSHRLQWRAMKLARERGCTSYDLFGIPPSRNPSHPMHGLFRFKTGFGGRVLHRRGCWDYPFDPDRYAQVRGLELAGEGFHRPGG